MSGPVKGIAPPRTDGWNTVTKGEMDAMMAAGDQINLSSLRKLRKDAADKERDQLRRGLLPAHYGVRGFNSVRIERTDDENTMAELQDLRELQYAVASAAARSVRLRVSIGNTYRLADLVSSVESLFDQKLKPSECKACERYRVVAQSAVEAAERTATENANRRVEGRERTLDSILAGSWRIESDGTRYWAYCGLDKRGPFNKDAAVECVIEHLCAEYQYKRGR